MTKALDGKRIAILATDGVEQSELTRPLEALREAGADVDVVSLETGEVQMFEHLDAAETIGADRAVKDADPGEYDGLVLPGGVANPDRLRTDEDAVSFVRGFFDGAKPVAAICHGPWTLVEADVVDGRTLTSWPSLRTDLRNAGATWVDEEVHVDGELITSRNPDDLPAFCSAMVDAFARAPASSH
ncbi:MAG TPA: type 1 glutamine amidotransferase domain-containing protein [Solirubrobacteraceae bacterium]|jgi:protease I